MSRYLTQEWLDDFVSQAADQPPRPGATVRVQYTVTGGPDGDIRYFWIVDEGQIRDARVGTIDDADFSMIQSYEDAARIQRGELEATAAFMQGKLKVTGNMARMMSLLPITTSPEWKALQDKVNELTEY
jgi:putative sterol carrier protein